MELKNFKALSFDCYGTLVDWEKGIADVLLPWASENNLSVSKEALLEHFAGIETVVQQENPAWKYPKVLEEVAARLSDKLGVKVDPAFQEKLAQSVGDWPAFSDTVEALKELEKHYKLIILSNISEESFAQTNNNQLGIHFFRVLTAERIGTYKPDLNNFHFLIDHLAEEGIKKEEILHVAQSLYHDMVPATDIGLSTVWINRRQNSPGFGATPAPSRPVEVDLEFPTMGEFANYVKKTF